LTAVDSAAKLDVLRSLGADKVIDYLKDLIEQRKIRAVIDRSYPLDQISEAHTYVETGMKAGNVVINVGQSD
jgi:NADPH:quinone reductase-like Zn-dependent oxidoreductase